MIKSEKKRRSLCAAMEDAMYLRFGNVLEVARSPVTVVVVSNPIGRDRVVEALLKFKDANSSWKSSKGSQEAVDELKVSNSRIACWSVEDDFPSQL